MPRLNDIYLVFTLYTHAAPSPIPSTGSQYQTRSTWLHRSPRSGLRSSEYIHYYTLSPPNKDRHKDRDSGLSRLLRIRLSSLPCLVCRLEPFEGWTSRDWRSRRRGRCAIALGQGCGRRIVRLFSRRARSRGILGGLRLERSGGLPEIPRIGFESQNRCHR